MTDVQTMYRLTTGYNDRLCNSEERNYTLIKDPKNYDRKIQDRERT
jgi:hypothetical protein